MDSLNKTKFDRLKRLKRLAEMEIGLCKTVGEKAQLSGMVASKTVPSEEQLDQFRKRINELEKTRVRAIKISFFHKFNYDIVFLIDAHVQSERLDRLVDIQEKANKIWAELECEPSGELAVVHSSTAIKTYVFSVDNMAKLEQSYKQVS